MSAADLHARWQAHWHDILDASPLVTDPRPDPLPPCDSDARLHFGIWRLPATDCPAAFAPLPEGAALGERAALWPLDMRRLPRNEAHALLRTAVADLRLFGLDAPESDAPIRFETPFPDALDGTDAPTINMDDALWNMAAARSPAHEAALAFLSEPFYRAADSYDVAHWLMWPLVAPNDAPDVYYPFALLRAGGWAAGWHSDGALVLVETDISHA
ncbi:hypothetical protein [Sagittula stellata]|uniref:Amidophosphoribosyltransferase n=1 Tax=Sagittula stellata (strain ATCC 700073 / DSM 11524 / E-37) TaxID=388399 RepID=A3JYZ6_SAGS3|nr:hypothetical protein [Sagittula stellata]EBA09699.1 amidophosphoribosyltransferase [Sagittula stellata E-37]